MLKSRFLALIVLLTAAHDNTVEGFLVSTTTALNNVFIGDNATNNGTWGFSTNSTAKGIVVASSGSGNPSGLASSGFETATLNGVAARFSLGACTDSAGSACITSGAGAPSAANCTASKIGSIYQRNDGSTGTSFYVCTAAGTWTVPAYAADLPIVPMSTWSPFVGGSGTLNAEYAGITPVTNIAIKRVQAFSGTTPAGCTTSVQLCVWNGSACLTGTTLTLANGNQLADSGAISVSSPAGTKLTIRNVQAPSGCTTSFANANIAVQYQ